MDRMVSLACLSLVFTLQVCLASVSVKTNPTVDVILGDTARLPCTYSATGSIAVVQWFIESAGIRKRVAYSSPTGSDRGIDKNTPLADHITMEEDMTLVISPVKVVDERSFFCQLVGVQGTSENVTNLRVFFAPEKPVVSENKEIIPLSPEDPTVNQVGKCTSSNGHPEPRIIWFKDSKPLPEVTDPKGNMHYMVPSVVKESSGLFTVTSTLNLQLNKTDAKSVFQCTVEYRMPNGGIEKENSEPFNLTLLYPGENVFFKLLNTTPIKEGDDVQMKCETDGNPQPQFEFSKDDKDVQQTETGLFILRNVTRSDSGIYKCFAMDFEASHDLITTLDINVHYLDPVSVVPDSPLSVNKGDPIELQCKTKSPDGYTISWMKDGKDLSSKGVLALQSAKLENAGDYVCIASVPGVPGLKKQASIKVIVSGQPEIDEPMTGKVAKEGDKVRLECSAQGYPVPQFTWKPSGKESLEFNNTTVTSIIELEATAAVLKDGVTCEASNEHGADSKKFMVEIQSDNTISPNNSPEADIQNYGSKGVVVAVLVCVLLLLLLVAVLYFLSSKGRAACQKKEKKKVASGEVNDDIVVEMKSGEKPNEESGLLNKPHAEQ